MCGICGLIDLTRSGRADPALCRRMADQIRHRGPDGDGFYDAPNVSLGMRRLSIIDVRGSDQPLYNEDRTIAMVFNGEIYNYRELRDLLKRRNHILNTEGDGETIIHLYEEYGLSLFNHLRGMYAFALWDTKNDRLLLAVDHIGMKPLYLHQRDGRLHFASEAKALYADPQTPREINLDTLDTYMSFGYMIGAETLFAGVTRLPPGHALVVDAGTEPRLHPFWQFPAPTRTGSSAEGVVVTEARDLLGDAVRLHLRSDVPLGLFLSGGIDSAAVLALMSREAGGRIKSYTVGYDTPTPDNELLHARRIAEHFKTEHHERVIGAAEWWDGLLTAVYHHDEPIANSSAISLLLLAQDTAREVKVVLTGLGGDELFGGYATHQMLPQLLANQAQWGKLLAPLDGPLGAVESAYPAMKRFRVIGALPTYLPRIRQAGMSRDEAIRRMVSFDGMAFSDALRERLYTPEVRAAWQRARHKEQTFGAIIQRSWRENPHDAAQALMINTWLTGNALLHTDKVTMASSLEARVPFFDPALLKFAANVPPDVRMKSNKYVLRQALRPLLPEFALERPKQPFGTPILNWFDNELSANIRSVLMDPNAYILQFFDRAELERLLKDHFWGRTSQVEVVFRLLTLELWGQRFIKPASFERAMGIPAA
jgi:asparagine synthase (glutamine-hydrolysing)